MKKSELPDPFDQARIEKGLGEMNDQDDPVVMVLRHKDVRKCAHNWKTFQSGAQPGRIVIPSEVAIRDTRQIPAVQHNVEGIDADCGGVCSCATCHVHVQPEYWDRIGAQSEIEKDMLELEDEVNEFSRLSCQLEISDVLDGIVLNVANKKIIKRNA